MYVPLYLPVAFLIIALQQALDVATQVSVAIARAAVMCRASGRWRAASSGSA
jgi:hypothetical protein